MDHNVTVPSSGHMLKQGNILREHPVYLFIWAQEWTSFVLARQANLLELLFITTDLWVDECLYVNKSLNSISSSLSLFRKFGINNSIHMDEIYNIIMKVLSQSSSIVDRLRSDIKLSDFIKKISLFVFWRWTKVSRVLNEMRVGN